MIPNACVVEVIERVPDADVAIVAARVGERLGMPQERVRQLIDGRTGPITRALRPEKADAIAQTFEAAGVRVVIRAADADEIEEARSAGGAAKPAEAPADPAVDTDPEPEQATGSEPPVDPEFDQASEPDEAPEFDDDPALQFAGEPPIELDPTSDPAPAFEPEPDPAMDDDLVPGPDAPTEQGLAREVAYIFATGEAPAWRGESVDLDAHDPGEERWSDDVDVDVDVDVDGHEARGEVAGADGSRTQDAFPPVGDWDADGAGAWSTRRGDMDASPQGPDVPTFAIGRASRRPRDGASEQGVEESPPPEAAAAPEVPPADVVYGTEVPPAVFVHAPMAPAPRPVPTAWRGLGGAEAGPARPPTARLPRRDDAYEEPRFTFDEPPIRRRAVMLAALGVAVALFVLAQWWVASRADASGVDPYDAYRRGEFAAARAVWGTNAAAGDPSARFMLGYLAEAGLGAPWSARTAAGWYRAAADVGHAEAMWRLARLYEVGLGVDPDTLEARRWYRSAAQAGHAEAAFAWGRLVLRDAGVALGAGAAPQVGAATAAEVAAAFELATELGWHEAAPYAAAFAALVVEGP